MDQALQTLMMFGPDLGFLDPYEYEIYNQGHRGQPQQHHHMVQANHPMVQAFDAISFVAGFVQQNSFLIYVTSAMAVCSVLFNVWLGGLAVFEYDKDNLILDQKTREEIPPDSAGGPDSPDDVFPNRDFNSD